MSKEVYVSFETAKHLKEKEFDWKVFHFYDENGTFRHREGDCYSLYNWNYPTKDEYGSHYCSAPTQQMACRWLRKEKGIHILPEISEVKENPKYYCMIWKTSTLESFIIELFDSYEDAIEAALQYCLTNLI
jgi:hypothetical protein